MQVLLQHEEALGTAPHLWSFLVDPENRQAVATAGPPPPRKKTSADDTDVEEEVLHQWKLGVGPVDKNGHLLVYEGASPVSLHPSTVCHVSAEAEEWVLWAAMGAHCCPRNPLPQLQPEQVKTVCLI